MSFFSSFDLEMCGCCDVTADLIRVSSRASWRHFRGNEPVGSSRCLSLPLTSSIHSAATIHNVKAINCSEFFFDNFGPTVSCEVLPWKQMLCTVQWMLAADLWSAHTVRPSAGGPRQEPLPLKASAPAEGLSCKALNSYQLLSCCSESRFPPWPLTRLRRVATIQIPHWNVLIKKRRKKKDLWVFQLHVCNRVRLRKRAWLSGSHTERTETVFTDLVPGRVSRCCRLVKSNFNAFNTAGTHRDCSAPQNNNTNTHTCQRFHSTAQN